MTAFRSGFAAIIGRPNVGKSTLMNHLVGQKIAITSKKPQTTRERIRTVLTTDRGQVVFVDTPGYIRKAGNKLGEYMKEYTLGALPDSDALLWLIEPSSHVGEGDREIAEHLADSHMPVILVINKTDTIPHEHLLGIIDTWKDVHDFAAIVPVSALKGEGLDALVDELISVMPEGPMLYDEETLTDLSMRKIASEIIREKALRLLKDEVPHGIAVVIDEFKERDDGITDITASIIAEKDSHKGIIIGKGGRMIKAIGTKARADIEEMTGGRVFLQLFVKVRKDWRDNDMYLKEYGYGST